MAFASPLPRGTVGRTDQGVDISAPAGSPVLAIARESYVGTIPNWYRGQPFAWFKDLATGAYNYAAEQINFRAFKPGQIVQQGEQIGTVAAAGTGTEFGWATKSGATLARATTGYTEGQVTPAGQDYRRQVITGGTLAPSRSNPIQESLGALWIQAGGKPALANLMTAIALAESGGQVGARGARNSNGTYDYGLWQINSSHGYDVGRLTSDPLYNAQAAVAVQKSQGLGAWSTYNSGAYQAFMGKKGPQVSLGGGPNGGIVRPDGSAGAGGSAGGGGPDAVFASYQQMVNAPRSSSSQDVGFFGDVGGFLNGLPLVGGVFSTAGDAISGTVDFLKWIAWILHPVNILRMVEFLTGAAIMAAGVQSAMQGFSSTGATARRGSGAASRIVTQTVGRTPAGRVAKAATASRRGRQQARRELQGRKHKEAFDSGKRAETRRQSRRELARKSGTNRTARLTREGRAARREEIPF